MKRLTQDPLLGIARLLLLIGMGIFVLAGAACAVAIPILLFKHDEVVADLAVGGTGAGAFWLVIAILVAAIGLLALGFLFVRHMKRIVDSVAEGDPFVPENAQRLTAMAWLMLAIQVTAIPMAAAGLYIAKAFDEQEATVDAAFDVNGLILVLILFVLAHVFRKGTEMREDLEGTV